MIHSMSGVVPFSSSPLLNNLKLIWNFREYFFESSLEIEILKTSEISTYFGYICKLMIV